jgi:hypothetical protein
MYQVLAGDGRPWPCLAAGQPFQVDVLRAERVGWHKCISIWAVGPGAVVLLPLLLLLLLLWCLHPLRRQSVRCRLLPVLLWR